MKTKTEDERDTEENLRLVEAAGQKAGRKLAEEALEERLRFERLLSDLSARFVNILPEASGTEGRSSSRHSSLHT